MIGSRSHVSLDCRRVNGRDRRPEEKAWRLGFFLERWEEPDIITGVSKPECS